MAYNGYLIKIKDPDGLSDFIFPNELIKVESYSAKRNTLYSNSFTDMDGYTHADALSHRIDKIKFKTIPMNNSTFDSLMASISALYTEPISMTFDCEFYVPQTGQYQQESVHIGDFEPQIINVNDNSNSILYNEIQFTITVW